MIPEKLTLKGLYSYRNQAEIDFSTLCSADLFGIFGNVGSGKSAILEAVTYVLYGKIERLSSRDYYNMMNLRSDKMSLDFIFSHKGRRYRFTFEAKRKKNDFTKIDTPRRGGYMEKDGEWVPLFDKGGQVSAEGVLGLSYDNFRRTIIVPQGRFQEFLHLEKNGRTEMLMELFNLERFNLYAETASLYNRNSEKKAEAEGALSLLQEVSEEKLAETKKEFEKIETELETLSLEVSGSDKQLKEFEEIRGLENSLTEVEDQLRQKESEAEPVKKKKEVLLSYERCRNRFQAKIDRLESISEDIKNLEEGLDIAEKEYERLIKEYEEAKLHKNDLDDKYSRIDELKKQALWYLELSEGKSRQNSIKKLSEELGLKKAELDVLEKSAGEDSAELKRLYGELNGGEASKISYEEISRIADWYKEMAGCSAALNSGKDELKGLEARLGDLESGPAGLEGFIYFIERGLLVSVPGSIREADEKIETIEVTLAERARELRKKILAAEVAMNLKNLSETLEDGVPCPVCGSKNHPAPVKPETRRPAGLRNEEEAAAEDSLQLDRLKKDLAELKSEEYLLNEQIKGASERVEAENKRKAQLLDNFNSDIFSPEDPGGFRDFYADFIAGSSRKEEIHKQISELNLKIENNNKKISLLNGEMTKTNLDLKEAETRLSEVQARMDNGFRQKHEGLTAAELRDENKRAESLIRNLSEDFKAAEVKLGEISLALEGSRVKKSKIEEDIQQRLKAGNKTEAALNEKVADSDFSSLNEVFELLSLNIDPEKEREEIDQFNRTYEKLKNERERLAGLIDGRRYSEEQHNEQAERNSLLKKRLREQTSKSGEVQNIIRDLESKLDKKVKLEKELNALEVRGSNLSVLKNLFTGKRFINYAATIYLKELCAAANVRFRKLTKEALRLELDESNNFIVRDYLNEGKTRAVKTLSGGQTFQAAFSLSLALADSIGKERSGFFFLDEGFGSLDREALSLVFESLKSLKKENRTVGIISHVEELKQEIDTYISVVRDDEEGSSARGSWIS